MPGVASRNEQARLSSSAGRAGTVLGAQHRQRGATLLLVAVVLLVAMSSVILSNLGDANDLIRSSRDQQHNLRESREALLGYALAYPERNAGVGDAIPGFLPCPDRNGDGLADDTLCGAANESAIGFLPWKTLGLSPPKRHECLFYAVSGGFKSPNSAATPATLNTDTNGAFQIEDQRGGVQGGTSAATRAIAVVFLPGEQLVTSTRAQVRSSSSTRTHCGATTVNNPINLARNYLEQIGVVDNATGTKSGMSVGDPGGQAIPSRYPSVFVVAPIEKTGTTIQFNDNAIWIGSNDYAPVRQRMNEWVLRKTQSCLTAYGDAHVVGGTRRYPWPALLDSSGIPNYSETANQRFGRIPETFINASTHWENEPGSSPAVTCFSWPWWNNWREHIFLAVDNAHSNVPAGASSSLELDGIHSEFVVLLANQQTSTQSRSSYAHQGQINNYLELDNIPGTGAGLIPGGSEQFISNSALGTFNDLACSRDACAF